MHALRFAPLFAFLLSFAAASEAVAQGGFADDFDSDFGDPGPAPVPAPGTQEDRATSPATTDDDFFEDVEPEPADEAVEPEAVGSEASIDETPLTEAEYELKHRLFLNQGTFLGPIGGIHVVDAGGGAVGTFRFGLTTDFFIKRNYLVPGDRQEHIGGALAMSWTPHRAIEVFGALRSYANSNTTGDPRLLQVLGDTLFGIKAFHRLTPVITVGGDLSGAILNTVGDIGVVFRSTSGGARLNFTTDLRGLDRPIPFVFRFNTQYWFDNSGNLIRDVESARYQNLEDPSPIRDEHRHLITPVERFGLMINRLDFMHLNFGFEAPFEPRRGFLVSPILEWRWAIPVNRQGYDCLFIPDAPGSSTPAAGHESCLDIEGPSAFPMSLTLGLRLSPVRGLGILVGADVGLTGTRSTPVRELAQTPPYAILLGLSYGYDPRPPPPTREVVEVAPEDEPGLLYSFARVHGVVVSASDDRGEGAGEPIAGAVVAFADADHNALVARSDGRFVTYRFRPGDEVTLAVSHPEYEEGRCVATIPEAPRSRASSGATAPEDREQPRPAGEPASGKQGDFDDEGPSEASERAGQGEPQLDESGDLIVELRCELVPRPRMGSIAATVVNDSGAPVSGASVAFEGPESQTATADASGRVAIESIQPGRYNVRIEAEGYLLKVDEVVVEAREEATPRLTLIARPSRPLANVRGRRIAIRRQVNFATNNAEILPSSDPLLYELAEIFERNPDIRLVEIQGHTDDRGGAAHNMRLSQERADAVRDWLVEHGVDANRIEARGYGLTQPIVPNITPANRARNRRVQFVIKDRSE